MSIKRNFWALVVLGLSFSACKSPKQLNHAKAKSHKEKKKGKALTEKEQIQFEYTFFEAQKQKILGNYEQALSAFLEALTVDGENATALYEAAQLYLITDQLSQALEFATLASDLEPENRWFLLLKAEVYKKMGRFSDEAAVYKTLLDRSPDEFDLYYACAAAHIENRDYQAALKIYNALEKEQGLLEEVSIQKERLYILLGDVDKAANELNKLIEKYPKEVRFYGLLAELYIANDLEAKAEKSYHQILEIDPDEPRANLALADIYKNQGDAEKSYEHLLRAFKSKELEMDHKWPILVSFFALSEKHPEYNDKTQELIRIVREAHPEEATVYALSGDIFNRSGDKKAALASYAKAADLGIEQFVVYNQILLLHYELQEYEKLIVEADKIVEKFPLQPSVYLLKGTAEIVLKRHEAAIQTLSSGADFVVDNPSMKAQFYASIGDSYHSLAQYNESDEAYEKSLKYFPDNPNVLNNYSYYLSLRKEKLDTAEKMSRKSNELMPGVASYQDTYAWILFLQQKYPEAEEWFLKAMENGGESSAVIIEHYGDLLYHMDKKDAALQQWEKALKLGGDHGKQLEKKIRDKKYYEED